MAALYSKHELYGGAITVDLPSDYIDTSTLRQVPDHQEVYLSPTTLTSLIFEINTYQTSSEIQDENINIPSSLLNHDVQPVTEDQKATIHHFLDPILPPDHIDPTTLTVPQPIVLKSSTLKSYPAYTTSGTITCPGIDKKASSALPMEWARSPPTINHETKVYQLLVRMERYETDFCVRINVPLKEMVGDEGKMQKETRFVEELLGKIVMSLDVVSFELFGEDA